jgi:hypothetical protein
MALNFPINPNAGDTFQTADTVWQYDGVVWNVLSNNPNALQLLSNIDKQTNNPDATPGLVLTSAGDTTYDFQSPIDTLVELNDVDTVTNDPLNQLGRYLTTDGNGGFFFTIRGDNLSGLADVDSDTNTPLTVAGRILQSDGLGGFLFSSITLSQVSNVNLTSNSPNSTPDLVLTSVGAGSYQFKPLDDISSSSLTAADIGIVNGVLAYDENLNTFIQQFQLPTTSSNNGFLYNNAGTITTTNNVFTGLGSWQILTNVNGDLIFQYNGVNMVAFRTNGEIEAKDDITAMTGTIV